MNARKIALATLAAGALGAMPVAASAAPHEVPRQGYVLDGRYQHNHYYPPRGADIRVVPRGGSRVYYRGAPYYFHGGAWYRPWGPRYRVIAPPFGIGIRILPPFYSTVWFGGVRYYYADDTYYLWHPESREYVVTAPPTESTGAGEANAPIPDPYAYPSRGQSAEQQSTDRYECHTWAVQQSGFDPTQPLGGAAPTAAAGMRENYQRAEQACLEGRGYTVR